MYHIRWAYCFSYTCHILVYRYTCRFWPPNRVGAWRSTAERIEQRCNRGNRCTAGAMALCLMYTYIIYLYMNDLIVFLNIITSLVIYYEYIWSLIEKMDIKYGYDMIIWYMTTQTVNHSLLSPRRCQGSWNPRPQRSPVCSGAMLIHRFSGLKGLLIGICKTPS